MLLPDGVVFAFSNDTTFDYILLFDVILGQLQEAGQMVRELKAGRRLIALGTSTSYDMTA